MKKGEAIKRPALQARIPTRIKVGHKRYSIDVVETMLRKGEMGRVYFDDGVIRLATKSNTCGRTFSRDEIDTTFWHEMVHAILHDMGHPLWRNEDFVTRFANRLSTAIKTAKFK